MLVAAAAPSTTSGINNVATTYYENWKTISGDSDEDDGPPILVDESSDEEWHQSGEILSECSSADTEDRFDFLTSNYNADRGSEGESAEDTGTFQSASTADGIKHCTCCLKPKWSRSYNPKYRYCRDHCMHTTTTHADLHQDAPTLQKEQNPIIFIIIVQPYAAT